MSVPVDTPAPADEAYSKLCVRLSFLEKEAGAFLARSMREGESHPEASMRIARDLAAEANEVGDQMKAWRLANGYPA